MIVNDAPMLTDLVAAIYRAGYAASEWPDVIEQLRLQLNGARACFVRIGLDMRPDDVLATESDPHFDQAFAQDARLHSNVFSRTVDRLPLGPVLRHEEIWDADTLHRSPLWNEYLSPLEIHSGLMAKTLATNSSYWFFGVSRSRRCTTFGEGERALMAVLSPHFRRATQIGRALSLERRSSDARVMWLGTEIGFLTIDSEHRIIGIDGAADAILSRPGCILRQREGRLECRGAVGARFAGLVRQACRTSGNPVHVGGGEMVARADRYIDGSVDVLLSIGPVLERDRAAPVAEPGAVIAMRELSPVLPSGFAATAAQAFELTPKEAEIAALLASGHTLTEAAASQGMSIFTARGHLKQLFLKTETHQQSALVAMLRTIDPLVRSR